MAATNLEGSLDTAVWRRFDEVVMFDPPGEAEIAELLNLRFRNLQSDPFETVDIRHLTKRDYPTPITRTGPGVNGAVKPELVDYGGTAVFNGGTQKLMLGAHWDTAGIVTMHAKYQDALFTAATGTSMAARRRCAPLSAIPTV